MKVSQVKASQLVLAFVPWGDVFEDLYGSIGVSSINTVPESSAACSLSQRHVPYTAELRSLSMSWDPQKLNQHA